jgi:hypothetical protein
MKTKLFFLASILTTILSAQTALNFDGINDYVLGSNNTSLNLMQGTIEAWIKTSNAGSGTRGILVKQYQYGMALKDNSLVVAEWGQGEKNSNINIADNTWHHVAFSFSNMVANGSKLYIDGLPVLAFTYQVSTNSSQHIIAGAGNASLQYFNGVIDQVRVWNSAKTDAEILANYNKCINGTETGLVMYWNFDEGTGTTVSDLTGNNNHGTLTNIDSTTNWVLGYDCSLVAYYPFNGNANDESGNSLHGTVSGATLTTDRFGNLDSAYSFDGSDIITIAHNDLLNCSEELSFSVWIKPNTLQNAMILGKSNYVTATNYLLRTKSTGYLQFEYQDFANSNSLPLVAGVWNHIAVVSNTDNSKNLYINGVLASHTTATSPYGLVTNALTIGARPGAEYFNGSIDDLRMYKSALSASDVLNLYNNNSLAISNNLIKQLHSFYVFKNILYVDDNQKISEIKKITIHNLLAQKVYESNNIQKETDISFLNQGIFILRVYYKNNSLEIKKFIIQ